MIIRTISLVVMIVSFVAYLAKAPAFPIADANILPCSAWFFISALANVILWQRVMKLLSFSLLVIWLYAFAASVVPETSTAQLDASSVERTVEAYIEAGEAIFYGKGKCHTCHTVDPSAPKSRCPDLTDVGLRAATRRPGMTAKEYLIEATYEPHKFLVPGYGNIMPPVWKAPISLSNPEIEMVIAFLQGQGADVDLTPFRPPVDTASEVTDFEVLPPLLTGDVERGKTVFVSGAKCIACHEVNGLVKPSAQVFDDVVEVVAAPDLTEISGMNSLRYIEESILKPNEQIVSGYGAVTVRTGGGSIQGRLLSQDNEQIVVRSKDQEHTIQLSEFDPEPIENLDNLKERGYFWISVTLAGTETSISGDFIEDDEENITVQVGSEMKTVSKSNVKVQATVVDFDEYVTVGELVSENEDEITLNVDGEEQTIDKFDIDEGPTYSRAYGKRLDVISPMPDNFPLLLSVADMSDLLAFMSTLTGTIDETAVQSEAPLKE